jgi:hypothetical protein
MKVYYAVWSNHYGTEVLVNKTEKGRVQDVCEIVILPWLDDLDDENARKQIKKLIKAKKYSEAIRAWGEEQGEARGREENVEFGETTIGE